MSEAVEPAAQRTRVKYFALAFFVVLVTGLGAIPPASHVLQQADAKAIFR
jgi:hypothetical protein